MIPKDRSIFETFSWKKEYSAVLILNALYIAIFFYLMITYG